MTCNSELVINEAINYVIHKSYIMKKVLSICFLLSLTLYGCSEDDLKPEASVHDKNPVFELNNETIANSRSSGVCSCEDVDIVIHQRVNDEENEGCCITQIDVNFPQECAYEVVLTASDLINGGFIDVLTGTNTPEGLTYYVRTCELGNPFASRVGINVIVNGESCAVYAIKSSCEAPCSDCGISLTESDCEITACLDRFCDINSIFAAFWTTPTGTFPQSIGTGGAAVLQCYNIPAEDEGEYCFTVIDGDGCETKECIVQQKNCCGPGVYPEYQIIENYPAYISVECVNGSLITRINRSITTNCNQCCDELDEPKYIKFNTISELWNITKNTRVFRITGTEGPSHWCGGTSAGDGADRSYLCPNGISVGDVLQGTWSYEVADWEGCEPVPQTSFGGTVTYTVTQDDLTPCCL